MNIDHFTILLFGLFIKAMLGVLFLIFWLKTGAARPGLRGGARRFCSAACRGLFLLRGFGADFFSIGVGVASLIAAFACCWQGARAFDKRPPLWLAGAAGAGHLARGLPGAGLPRQRRLSRRAVVAADGAADCA